MQHRFSIDRRRHYVHALGMAVLATAALYLLLTGLSLAHIAERQSLLKKVGDTHASLISLETRYLKAADGITPSLIEVRGLSVSGNVHFVTRKPLGAAIVGADEL